MKAVFLILSLIGASFLSTAQNKHQTPKNTAGYKIDLTLKPLKNQWVYLYSYYGKSFQLHDSAMLSNAGKLSFTGNNKLPGGIYLIVNENRARLFDFLMDEQQHFSIVADTAQLDKVVITGSKDNDIYNSYTQFLLEKAPLIAALETDLKTLKGADSVAARKKMIALNEEVMQFRANVIKNNPKSLLARFFAVMKNPDFPEVPVVNGVADSTYPFRYVKNHYWDDVDFADNSLLRTPFFEKKLEDYYKYYVSPEADSIIPDVNYMLLAARENKEMFHYLLGKFTDKYINPEIMGQDKVFVFLFNNFFAKGDTTWLNEKQREFVFNRAYFLMANQIGESGANMVLMGMAGKPQSLYEIKAPYTFVVFWDPNCGHCKETLPVIDSIYRARWKAIGVKIYAVNIDNKTLKEWRAYINERKIDDWVHVYETAEQRETAAKSGQANFRQLYDVYQTPTLFLLDKDKRIIAKKLDVEKFDQVLKMKQKSPNTKP